ncbi:MAG: hypothetical protein K1X74_17195 [Pirellulales bacterium]|nr:hypothetical protein [Pirellulales bacterium]
MRSQIVHWFELALFFLGTIVRVMPWWARRDRKPRVEAAIAVQPIRSQGRSTSRDVDHQETWPVTTVERLSWRGPSANGFSHSTVGYALRGAAELFYATGQTPPLAPIAQRVLAYERARAGNHSVAANDCTPILYGGVMGTVTKASGEVVPQRIGVDRAFLEEHLVWAYRPGGIKHQVPTALKRLFSHPSVRDYVQRISEVAQHAEQALRAEDPDRLSMAMVRYRELFWDGWGEGMLLNPEVPRVAEHLQGELGDRLLSWIGAGAGAASSIVVLTSHAAVTIATLKALGWRAYSAKVAEGLRFDYAQNQRRLTITAPQRIALVGAADLGADPAIAQDGYSIAVAIEPRSELVIELGE